jgi:hypothetical protein
MDLGFALLLVFGGLVAGFANTVAGGGSIVTLPLLMLAGLSPDVANGTNRVAILLQNVAATAGFRQHGLRVTRVSLILAVPASVGALLGAWIAVALDPEVLRSVFGVVLGLLSLVVFLRPGRWVKGREGGRRSVTSPLTWVIFFGIGVYGGFVQAGVGFLLLVGLVLWLGFDLVEANAVKVLTVLLYTAAALGVFVVSGQVAFGPGLLLATGNMAGGYAASVLSVKKGAGWVRGFLIVCALASSLKLLGLLS